jgi:rubrerythrin
MPSHSSRPEDKGKLTKREVAKLSGYHEGTIGNMVRDGKISELTPEIARELAQQRKAKEQTSQVAKQAEEEKSLLRNWRCEDCSYRIDKLAVDDARKGCPKCGGKLQPEP